MRKIEALGKWGAKAALHDAISECEDSDKVLIIQSGTMEQVNNINGLSLFQSGTRQDDVPLQKQSNYLESQVCSIVPLCEGVAEGEGISEGVVHLSEEDLLDDNGRLFNDAC